MNQLFLSFPQWQGAGYNHELYIGAKSLVKALKDKYSFTEVEVPVPHSLDVQNEIKGYSDLLKQLQRASELINKTQPERLFTIGGDCGTELAPINYLNCKHNRELAVLWIDAHADLNTPQSSPSHEFHGMPLRTLMGEGDEKFLSFIDAPLLPGQVFILGARDLDNAESDFISGQNIRNFTIKEIKNALPQINDHIKRQGFKKVYLHVDLDVLDPSEVSSVKCPTPEGLTKDELINLIKSIKTNFSLIGGNVLEYTHESSKDLNHVVQIVNMVFND